MCSRDCDVMSTEFGINTLPDDKRPSSTVGCLPSATVYVVLFEC